MLVIYFGQTPLAGHLEISTVGAPPVLITQHSTQDPSNGNNQVKQFKKLIVQSQFHLFKAKAHLFPNSPLTPYSVPIQVPPFQG